MRFAAAVAVCALLASALVACGDGGDDAASDEPKPQEATAGAEPALPAKEEPARDKAESALADKEQWAEEKQDKSSLSEGDALEAIVMLAEDADASVHYVDHPERERAVLLAPPGFVDGETPLVVSLHGFGGNAAYHTLYVPLHERVSTDGFALLLPNGQPDGDGNRFWNPTDECCEGGKSGEDDVAYLSELVSAAGKIKDFGPVYVFGYSNGGFMAHHMACKGLPGLRAVASLAGTSYVDDASCAGAPAVSVLHVHGTVDSVIRYEGDRSEASARGGVDAAFYVGAEEMVERWSQRAGCEWTEGLKAHATLDLDAFVPGAETQAFRVQSGCAPGIAIELWRGEGSGHAPGYDATFVDALLGWLLAQR